METTVQTDIGAAMSSIRTKERSSPRTHGMGLNEREHGQSNSKKRTRSQALDENEVITSTQKKRRIDSQTSDGETEIVVGSVETNLQRITEEFQCASEVTENEQSKIPVDENNNVSTIGTFVDKVDESKHILGQDVVVETNGDMQEIPTSINNDENEDAVEESLIVKEISKGVLTESMLDQEKKLHKINMDEEKEIVNKAMVEWESTVEQQRYTRLQHLLEKSNVYSEFLLQRIENQKEQNRLERIRAEKKAKKEESEEPAQTVPQRTRKNKAAASKYNITDYVDAEALKKNVQKTNSTTNQQSSSGESTSAASSQTEEGCVHVQPALLTGGTLRDYQFVGVEWLKVLYENGVNGILADEMGLGKTIQCIALFAHLIEKGVRGPFLVTAPLSTLPNWLSEFKKFTPAIPVILYHGSPDERCRLRNRIDKLHGNSKYTTYPVVITSYDIIMIDRKFLDKFVWKYVIVDEGHRIKNLKCKLLRELKAYPAANRLLLTGTPLQNNLSELWSLLNFLLPDIFDDLSSFQAWFDFSAMRERGGNEKIIAQEREHHVLKRLHDILTPFLLRRLKLDVHLDLPRKKEVVVYAPLTQQQDYWYKLFLDKTRLFKHFEKKQKTAPPVFSSSGRKTRNSSRNVEYAIFDDESVDYDQLMEKLMANEQSKRKSKEEANQVASPTVERHVKLANILMLLRKTCNHPYLLEYPLVQETGDYRIDEELITCCGKTLVLDQMLSALKERGHKVLLFSQMTMMLDIIEDFCYLRSYKYSRIDGKTKFEDRQTQIDDFNTDPNVFIFLLSTRAGGLGLNLTAADTVILYDSDWNPQQDLQAQDRCHRIGQTRPVVVYRYLTANTVDQRIVERAAEKRKLEKMIIHKGKFKGVRDGKSVSTKEMLELLESSDHMDVINTERNSNTKVLSKETLDKLLDRTDLLDVTSPNEENDHDNKQVKVIGVAE